CSCFKMPRVRICAPRSVGSRKNGQIQRIFMVAGWLLAFGLGLRNGGAVVRGCPQFHDKLRWCEAGRERQECRRVLGAKYSAAREFGYSKLQIESQESQLK